MRWLINYIRSCFCKHDWECIAENIEKYEDLKKQYHMNEYGFTDAKSVDAEIKLQPNRY